MDDVFAAIEARQTFIARGDVLELGLDDKYIRRCVRGGQWQRVRPGAYSLTGTWSLLDAAERHRVLARAVLRSLGDGYVLSHQSGLLFHPECEVWGVDLSRVHVTRRDGGSGGIEAGVVQHTARCVDDDVMEIGGLLVMKPARGVIETSMVSSVEAGLVAADSALYRRRTSADELSDALGRAAGWRGRRRADLVVRMADERAESVGESRSRFLCWSQGLPRPELQYEVYDERGKLVAITDLAWPAHRLLGEFDGRIKYGRLVKSGQEPGDVVFEEKKREDQVRRLTGFSMFRMTWSDLSRPALTASRARQLMNDVA